MDPTVTYTLPIIVLRVKDNDRFAKQSKNGDSRNAIKKRTEGFRI